MKVHVAAVLLDVEGTTTTLAFVHEVLFPYATAHLPGYVQAHGHEREVRAWLDAAAATAEAEGFVVANDLELVATLQEWSRADRKHPALKGLQGLVWRSGYESGAFRGHLYDDVPPTLACWQRAGLRLAVYSSGSVAAQRLLFRHSTHGDLSGLFAAHFDTAVGPKREPSSYARIAAELALASARVAFLSDVSEELDAAAAVGMVTVQIVRPGTTPGDRHPTAAELAGAGDMLGL